MALPRTLARLNKIGLNRVTTRLAPVVPGFGVVVHQGRRSGRRYQTPVNVFGSGPGYVIALTYGPDSDWVRNVLAAGRCELRTGGRTVALTAPRLYRDEERRHIRPAERAVLRALAWPISCPWNPRR
jgi:deazaflavin-dependent oxidoreductase (nitroreductase family)